MIPTQTYKKFLTELIRRHMEILGPNIARDTALGVAGLTIDGNGEATELSGNGMLILKDLVDSYMTLCAPATQLIFYALLQDFPDVKNEWTQPITKVNLVCSLTDNSAK